MVLLPSRHRASVLASFLGLAGLLLAGSARAEKAGDFTAAEFVTVSNPVDPRVAFAARVSGSQLELEVAVAADESGAQPQVEVAAAMQASRMLKGEKPSRDRDSFHYRFRFARADLKPADQGWSGLRVAFRVVWPQGGSLPPRLVERYRDEGPGAPFDPLSADYRQWKTLDLASYMAEVAARRDGLAIDFEQPQNGRASIVIDDQHGQRVRNLVSGADFARGSQHVVWDGLNDDGHPVEPGEYHWQAVTHAGIKPDYLFSFYNSGNPPYGREFPTSNWGGDHSNPMAATTSGDDIFIGWPVAESGNNIIQLDPQGHKVSDYNIPAHCGGQLLMLAADAQRIYAAVEGTPAYEAFTQEPGGKWTCRRPTSILAWNRQRQPVRYGGPRGEIVIANNLITGSGPVPKRVAPPENLGGFAQLGGKLYVSLRQEKRIAIFDPATGKPAGEIPLDRPGLLAATPDGKLAAFSGETLGLIDPAHPKFIALSQPKVANPRGLAVSSAGEFYISDNGPDQDIKVLSSKGKLVRTIGTKGGRPSLGAWRSDGFYQPFGIALDNEGQLWVAEDDRTPRRVSSWTAATGLLVKEFFGPCNYGAPGGGFDPQQSDRWIGAGTLWQLDFAQKSARPLSTLYRKTSPAQPIRELQEMLYHIVHKDGRTFVIGQSKQTIVYELSKDQTLHPWAIASSVQRVANERRWLLPLPMANVPAIRQALTDAATKAKLDPAALFQPSPRDPWSCEIPETLLRDADLSFLWVDRNGDGEMQPEEFEFFPDGQKWVLGYWGNGFLDTALALPAQVGDKLVLVPLTPDGYLPSGAPNYSLAEGLKKAVPLDPAPTKGISATIIDRQKRLLMNTSPMMAFDLAGHRLWTIPNNWVDVHGSHNAPLPRQGEMQGDLFYLGAAPLDSRSDVAIINGNHGRFFVLTTDGVYLDEMFSDVRVAQQTDAYRIGGEPFGGFFERSETDGKYYLQSGHTDYRIFQINGLDTVKRATGSFSVTPAQAAAAAAIAAKKSATEEAVSHEAAVTDLKGNSEPGADPETWPGPWQGEWGEKSATYPYARVKILRRGDRLLLAWQVKDPSPWRNTGKDWMQLFKTGDALAFEFSTDPDAKPDRKAPVAGDKRLLLAMFDGQPTAVLYDYRNPAAKEPISFSSPWRSEKIAAVTRLSDAKITTQPRDDGYTVVANLPLADLGLPATGAAHLQGDFGVIYGDAAGTIDLLRSYWSNRDTGLVNDVPGEAAIAPANWGKLIFKP